MDTQKGAIVEAAKKKIVRLLVVEDAVPTLAHKLMEWALACAIEDVSGLSLVKVPKKWKLN